MNRKSAILVALGAVCLFATVPLRAGTVVFLENFEGGNLSQWASNNSGEIVTDPLDSANHALNFTRFTGGGDLVSGVIPLTDGDQYVFSFDYLGVSPFDGNPYISTNGGSYYWWVGRDSESIIAPVSDGTWHHYSIPFTPASLGTPLNLGLESWYSGGSHPDDAYFDNIMVTGVTVPEPSMLLALAAAGALLAAVRARR